MTRTNAVVMALATQLAATRAELAPGVYGLLSSKLPVDNSGFVVGTHGVLVIDAHINGAMAGRIQTAVRQITNKPILYVVNTNYHGVSFAKTPSGGKWLICRL